MQKTGLKSAKTGFKHAKTTHRMVFSAKYKQKIQAIVKTLGLERVELYRVSGRVGFERSGIGSSRVFHKQLFRVSGFDLRVSGSIRVMNLVLRFD